MRICVFGAASNEIDEKYITEVERFGALMAKRGHELVFGAGMNGLMGACARGIKSVGANVVGVIPSFFKEESIEAIFPQCDELIYTETMAKRKAKMEDLAEAFVIVPGGIGTFEEFFEVLTLKQLGRHTKPIAIYNIEDYYNNLEDFLKNAYEKGFIRNDCRKLYFCSKDANEILEYVENDEPIGLTVHDLKDG